MRISRVAVPALAFALGTAALAVGPSTAAQAAAASNTLVVNAATNLRPVTHVASGALYGLASNGVPAASLVNPLHPSSFVQMAPGGTQRPGGDALVVAPEAAAAGAKVIVRMPDWYPNFPYSWVSWSDWLSAVDKQIASVKASGATNIGAYEIWNEPDWTWNTSAAGDFDAGWVRTYQEIRSKDATTPIDGPSFSYFGPNGMTAFLTYAKANNALPDLVSWHELGGDTNIAADVASYRSIESSLGISPRPIIIEEYASTSEIGVPGSLVGYVAKFERAGVTYADLPFWNDYGTLGDLLVSRGGAANAGWWLYKWYGDMSGQMVATVPPAQTGIDGAAAVNAARNQVSVIVGGGSGDAAVTVNGLSSLSGFGATAHVVVEHVVSRGRTTAGTPTTMSTGDIPISGGSISVPIPAMNAADGYHLIITPSAGSTGTGTCQVTYAKSEWTGGLTANLTIADTGTSAINGWTLKFSFPGDQKVTNAWNGTVTQSGQAVTAVNVSYNATIAPGGNTTFGFQGTWTANDSNPTAFTLNGTPCTTG